MKKILHYSTILFKFYYYMFMKKYHDIHKILANKRDSAVLYFTPIIIFILLASLFSLSLIFGIPIVIIHSLCISNMVLKIKYISISHDLKEANNKLGIVIDELRKERTKNILNESHRKYWEDQKRKRKKEELHNQNIANAMNLLGLSYGFTEEDVKKAYKRLSKIHHPDVGGLPENFKRLKKAYDYLINNM